MRDPRSSATVGTRARLPRAGRSRRWLALLGLVWLGTAAAVGAEVTVSKEYQIKAAFLYNFTKFVEWPTVRFVDETSPIIIGVLGENPFGDELGKIVRDRKVNGREIVVQSLASARDAGSVHLLFVTEHGEKLLDPVQARPAGVLTVGESGQFAARGGIIRFTLAGDKVRFEINQAASEAAGLKLSAQLLKLATAVHRKP